MDLKALIRRLFPTKPELTLGQLREGLSRRRFLGMAGGAALGVVVAPELFELLKPSSIIALPSEMVSIAPIMMMKGNHLLTMSMITNEALKVLEANLRFADGIHRSYAPIFSTPGNTAIGIRRPPRYTQISYDIDIL